jgi:hypothetical protein
VPSIPTYGSVDPGATGVTVQGVDCGWFREKRGYWSERPVTRRRHVVAESVYKIVELVGTSEESWEKAAAAAVAKASESLRGLRIAEITEMDMQVEDGQVKAYRTKIKLSFKFES